jgi:hypothetical protein
MGIRKGKDGERRRRQSVAFGLLHGSSVSPPAIQPRGQVTDLRVSPRSGTINRPSPSSPWQVSQLCSFPTSSFKPSTIFSTLSSWPHSATMSSVSGLKGALKLYESDKIKDRAQGGELIREILSNRDNLLAFQETAGRDSGGGWIQCLFQAVVTEKRAASKSNASAQGWSISQIPPVIVSRRHNGVDSCDGAVQLTRL